MRTTSVGLAALAAALLLLAPAAARAQEGIVVADFSSSQIPAATYALTARGKLRRGTTSHVQIVKNLIDLVPDGQITVTGGSRGPVSRGHASQGTGFIAFDVNVPASAGVGSTVTINVGFLDHFPFTVLHQGQISAVSFNPNPTTATGGTPITVTVSGSDLGSAPTIPAVTCHVLAAGNRTNTAFTVTLTRATSCSSAGPFSVQVKSSASGDPLFYTTGTGQIAFPFGPYAPTPGVTCISNPNILAPSIGQPVSGQVIVFAQGAAATQPITITWTERQGITVPQNDFLVEARTAAGVVVAKKSVTGFNTVLNLTVPGSYNVAVSPVNCGVAPRPAGSVNFQLKY